MTIFALAFTLFINLLTNRSSTCIRIHDQTQIFFCFWQIIMMTLTFLNTSTDNLCPWVHFTHPLRLRFCNRNQFSQSFSYKFDDSRKCCNTAIFVLIPSAHLVEIKNLYNTALSKGLQKYFMDFKLHKIKIR